MAAVRVDGELAEKQLQRVETVDPKLDALIDQANVYLSEYESEGDIADPGFREWLSHARAFLSVGLGSTAQARRRTPGMET
jgi:hypothetical protein